MPLFYAETQPWISAVLQIAGPAKPDLVPETADQRSRDVRNFPAARYLVAEPGSLSRLECASTNDSCYSHFMDLHRATTTALCTLWLCLGCSNAASSGGGAPTAPSDPSTSPSFVSSTDSVAPAPTPSPAGSDSTSGSEPSDPSSSSVETGLQSSADAAPPLETNAGDTHPLTSSDEATSDPTPVDTACTFDIGATLSEQIPTVGIVTFSTDLGTLDAGHIEFGLDARYGQRAPLDISAPDHRTVLLGMAPGTPYHYRIVAQSGDKLCQSEDQVITTGGAPTDLPIPTLRASLDSQVAPGYLVTSAQATGGAGGGYYIAIYDQRGQPVWWYRSSIGGLVTRAKLSWDGRFVYGRDGNPSARSGGQVVRIAIDGSAEETLTVDTSHHDLAVTPDNGVLFLVGGGGDGCGRIEKWSGTDEVSEFYDLRDAFGDAFKAGNDPCHCNSIHYNPEDTSVTVSCLTQNAYVKLSADAELLWVLGGNNGQSHFTGDVAWDRQHGHHMLTPNRLLFLNNNGGGDSTSSNSLAVELELDLVNATASRVWEYDGGEVTQTLGDVQRLSNGNTLVTYCNAGILHEVNTDEQLVQSWQFSNGVGYADHRESLYGVPLRP